MDWMNNVNEMLQKYRDVAPSAAPSQNVQADFSHLAEAAPTSVLASGLAAAFRSANTPAFPQMIAQLFDQSNAAQRAGILGHLLQAGGPAAASGGILSNLSGLFSGNHQSSVTPEQAQQVPTAAVQELAAKAQAHDPSIVDRASEFYAQHPTLVQGLGAAALAVLMSHVSQH